MLAIGPGTLRQPVHPRNGQDRSLRTKIAPQADILPPRALLHDRKRAGFSFYCLKIYNFV